MRGGGGAGDGSVGSGGTRNGTMKYVPSSTCYKMHHRPPITMQFAHCAHIILYIGM